MAKGNIKAGTYTGTGSAIVLQLGFVPDYFCTINITDADEKYEWFSGMAAGTAILTNTAVANQASNGVTAYQGTAGGNAAGLTLGTALSENAKVYRYLALSNQ